MNDLPDWQDDQGMYAWLTAKLDDQLEVDFKKANSPDRDYSEIREWLASDGPALRAAEHDDVTKLRERYPRLARFIHPMKLPRGQHRPSKRRVSIDDYDFKVRAAAADVPLIRKLWQKHYGRRNRARGMKTPEYFAAARWEVREDDVIRKLNPK